MKIATRLALAWAFLVCLLVGHNGYLWLVKRIVPDTDIMALLPVQERDPVLQQSFTHMVDAAQQRVVVLVGAPTWEDARAAADAYSAVLAARTDLFEPSLVNAGNEANWLSLFEQHRLALMTTAQEAELRTNPPAAWVEAALRKLYAPFGGPALGAWRDDPFGLFAGWVQERAQETPVRPRDGHLAVSDATRQYVLLPLTLKVPALSMTAQQTVLPVLKQAGGAARAVHANADVDLIEAGVILHAANASAQASGEVSTIGIGSLLGIVLITWLAFRSPKPILLILLSIGIGCLGALSVCALLFDRIHLMTLVFGASLIGVAQDYGIYFLFNRLCADPALGSHALLRRLMPGLCLTLLAAVIGYMGLAFTPFPGLRQMAVFSALGLVFAWLTVVCWFPLMIGATLKSGALVRVYGATLAHWPRARMNRATLVGATLYCVVAAIGVSRLGANDDIRLLQNPPKHLIADQIKLNKLLDAPPPVQYFLVRGATAELVLQREEALKLRLDPLAAAKRISGYQAMSNWVPSAQTQDRRRALIEQHLLQAGGPLASVATEAGEDAQWIATTRAALLAGGAPLTMDAFLQTPASAPWRHLWIGATDGGYASIVALRGLQSAAVPQMQSLAQGIDGVQWVDKVAEISSVLGRYRQNMGWVLLGAYALVFLLLLPRYRARAWRVLAPSALATVATLAVLGLASANLQLFHVLGLMLLLGVGVDYGIFLHEHPGRRNPVAWLAIGMSAANTILSFGLLALSHTAALQAFGLTMLLGTALVWLISPCFGSALESEHA